MDAKAGFLHLEVDDVNGVTVVRLLDPSLDHLARIMDVSQELSRLIEEKGIGHILLDMGPVKMVSSVMLGKLISLQSRLASNDAKLVLCNLHPRVQEICAITKLTRLFTIQPDRAAGLAALGAQSA